MRMNCVCQSFRLFAQVLIKMDFSGWHIYLAQHTNATSPPTAQLYLTLSNMYHIRILPSNRHVNSIQSHTAHARPHLKAAAAYSSYSSCCGTMLASQIESNWVKWNHMFSHLTHPKLHVTLRQRMLNLLQLLRHLKQMLTAFTAAFQSYF